MSSKSNNENRPECKVSRAFLLDSSKALKSNHPKRSPLRPINVEITQRDSPKTVNSQSHETTTKISNEPKITGIVGRSQLLKLYNALKANKKPEPSADLNQLIKAQNTEGSHPESSNSQATEHEQNKPLGLIDLNDFCLQRIIRSLHLEDIITVAGACTRLRKMACEVFKLILREHEVVIDCEYFPRYTINSNSNELPKRFFGRDLSSFVLAFGDMITKLTIINMFPEAVRDADRMETDAKIEELLTKNCHMQLNDITFRRCGTRAMSKADQFLEVTKVSFTNCSVGRKVCDFRSVFPNMNKLEIIDCDVTAVRDMIANPMPKLKCLDLHVPLNVNNWVGSSLTVENVKATIDLNPNIQSLGLCYWNDVVYDGKLLEYAALNLPNLKKLRLTHLRYTDFDSEGPILFTNVRVLTLTNNYYGRLSLGRLDRNLNALTFDGLQKFYMIGHFDTECLTFLARHRTIQKVIFIPTDQHQQIPTDGDLIAIGKILPNLQKIQVTGKQLTPMGLIRFIQQIDSLRRVHVNQFTFSAPIRRMFDFKCNDLGWSVTYADSIHGNEMLMKRMTH